MLKPAYRYDLEKFFVENSSAFQGLKLNVELFIEESYEKEVSKFLSKNGKTFKMIIYDILNNRYTDHFYKKLKGYDNLTEMRFAGGKALNARLYCKETLESDGKKIIVIYFVEKKKENEINNKTRNALNEKGGYQYAYKKREAATENS